MNTRDGQPYPYLLGVTGRRLTFREVRAAAYEEAAHADIGLELRYNLVLATIEPQLVHADGQREYLKDRPPLSSLTQQEREYIGNSTWDSYGHVQWNPGISVFDRHAIPMIMAGEIAQRKAGHRVERDTPDQKGIQRIAMCENLREQDLDAMRDTTTQLVQQRWPVIQKLANLLLAKVTLSGAEVREARIDMVVAA